MSEEFDPIEQPCVSPRELEQIRVIAGLSVTTVALTRQLSHVQARCTELKVDARVLQAQIVWLLRQVPAASREEVHRELLKVEEFVRAGK